MRSKQKRRLEIIGVFVPELRADQGLVPIVGLIVEAGVVLHVFCKEKEGEYPKQGG